MDKQRQQEPEQLKQRFSLRIIVFCAFALMFLVGTCLYAMTALSRQQAEKSLEAVRQVTFRAAGATAALESGLTEETQLPEEEETTGPVDFAALQQINPEICAWLTSEGTKIDYPVLHTNDNSYYMNHTYDRQYNEYGSLFVDLLNRGDFSDRNTVIFGHRILQDGGAMFGTLLQYMSQAYYDAHPTMMLYTPNGNYRLDLISGTEEGIDGEFVRFDFLTDEDFLDYVAAFRERSFFISDVELSPKDRIVSLCTCSYDQFGARFLVIGRLTPV